MDEWKARYLKMVGGVAQVIAAFGLMIGSDTHNPPVMIMGVVIGAVGLHFWGKGAEAGAKLPPPPPPVQFLEQDRTRERMDDVLVTLQQDVARLQEDRDFYKNLYLDAPHRKQTSGSES
jgi:hypothetical protein